ncbi:beta-ketoacyl synthase N-terminal-like domain-containing protein [Streptomyces sp. NPDC047990]|uniref:beta-ketoacyl synthase N-terminal-like domain-containing protein n=1 Tax=Streptomyces sp. NPDC047990 TaxID=3365496 RepID=UPI00370F902A
MDTREILTRFKSGTLRREHAVALLGGTPLPEAAGTPAQPGPAARPGDGTRPATDSDPAPTPAPAPTTATGPSLGLSPGPGGGAGGGGGVEACAVVGMEGCFPGAGDLDAWWRQALGQHARTAVPPWEEDRFANGAGEFGEGLLALFGLDAAGAARLDGRERLLARSAWQMLESAGYAGARTDRLTGPDNAGRGIGVYVAAGPAGTLGGSVPGAHLPGGAGAAGRLSRLLDLRGPSLSVDTGASSFLTALHLALAGLRAGECEAALAGAVELPPHPHPQLHAPHTHPRGPAGAGAGLGGGEGVRGGGVVVVLLKPLAAARAAGDRVYAVIRAGAAGHPGRLGAVAHHARLVGRALAAAGLPVPAAAPHGPDGDPWPPESAAPPGLPAVPGSAGGDDPAASRDALQALGIAVRETVRTAPDPAEPVNPAESVDLVGGTGVLAAAVALARAVGQVRHATLLPGPDRTAPAVWEQVRRDDGTTVPRRALVGVSAPPAADAVLVVEEAPRAHRPPAPAHPPARTHRPASAELVLLSAATPRQLAATAARLARWLSGAAHHGGPGGADLAAVAHELRLGRAALRCRLAVVAHTVPGLAAHLAAFAESAGPGRHPAGVHSADLRDAGEPLLLDGLAETRAYLAALWQGGHLEQLTRLWLAGADICAVLPAHPGPADIELPPTVLQPEPEPEPASGPELEPESESESELEPGPESESEPESESGPGSEQGAESGSGPGPGARPAPRPWPGPRPRSRSGADSAVRSVSRPQSQHGPQDRPVEPAPGAAGPGATGAGAGARVVSDAGTDGAQR